MTDEVVVDDAGEVEDGGEAGAEDGESSSDYELAATDGETSSGRRSKKGSKGSRRRLRSDQI